MILQKILLQNFRSYTNVDFEFSPKLTVIIGPNTAGKTNILEAIYLLATGGSFRAKVEKEMIKSWKELGRVIGEVESDSLEITLTTGSVQGKTAPYKRYLVNGVGRRKSDFVGNFYAVLFNPEDIELVTDSPSRRRVFLDNVLIQVSSEYARALTEYEKALRRRNKILSELRENWYTRGLRVSQVYQNTQDKLEYWDKLLVENGGIITKHREELIEFLNDKSTRMERMQTNKTNKQREKLQFSVEYDGSEISFERLKEYSEREVAAGYTLVGPHRDDFVIKTKDEGRRTKELSAYGSRGEQRLGVLWLKLGELEYLKEQTEEQPVLLLDDIFSELDHEHRELVTKIIPDYQTIVTTADKHYVEGLAEDNEDVRVVRL